MKRRFKNQRQFCLVLAFCLIGTTAGAEDNAAERAKEILRLADVKGGMVVHLGCEDGRLSAALRRNERFTVHALAYDIDSLQSVRSHIRQAGLYGPVSAELLRGSHLPYTDRLINLVVVTRQGGVPVEELTRVLAPGGAACIREDGQWRKLVKPWPKNIDTWTHFLHDASNNAVADDTAVGPPRHLQWVAPPLWLRSHETPSGIQAPVSDNGRLFYIFDEGLVGITDERLPDRWSLVCRDAFNGKLLWKRPLARWGWRQWNRGRYEGKDWTTLRAARVDVPEENQRRIVANGDLLYATLDYEAPVSILDAATGDVVATVSGTKNTREILCDDEMLVVYSTADAQGMLAAADARKGRVLWRKKVNMIRSLSLAVANGRIIYSAGRELVARNLEDGGEQWRIEPENANPKTVVTVDDVVVIQGGRSVAAYDAATGQELWSKKVPPIGGAESYDLFVVDGLVYRGIVCVDDDGKPVRKSENALAIGWDLHTGEEKRRILVQDLRSPEHHHRCYRNKATVRYLISSYEGAEFLDFQKDNHDQNNWVRGACKYGMMPCNGMLYVPPDQCFCQPGGKFLG